MSLSPGLLHRIHFRHARPIGPRPPAGAKAGHALHWIARHDFTLPETVPDLLWTIACERHYEIFLNGRSAVSQRNFFNGPLYLHGQIWRNEINRFLKPGANTIEVIIRFDPWSHKNHIPFLPFLLLEAAGEGTSPLLRTGSSWRIAVVPGEWRERIALGCTHLYEHIRLSGDADASPFGWPGACLDFQPARPLRQEKKWPPIFLSQSIPATLTLSRTPGTLVHAGECTLEHSENLSGLSRQLQGARRERSIPARLDDGTLHLPRSRSAVPQFVVLDFGRFTSSLLSFDIVTENPGSLAIAYGDHLHGDSVDCARMERMASELVELPGGRVRYRGSEPRSFRFLAFFFFGFEGAIRLDGFAIEERNYLRTEGSSFLSSEASINALWRASLRTTRLCRSEIFMDNPDREQGQWIDNALPLMETGYYWAAETQQAARTLAEYAQNQTPQGELPGYAPGRWFPRLPLQCHMGLYVVACHNHYLHTGDLRHARAIFPSLLRMQRHWERHRTARGLIADIHTLFVDWGSHLYSYNYWFTKRPLPEKTGCLSAMNAYYLLALRRMEDIARDLGRDSLVREFHHIATEVRRAMRRHLLDSHTGLFRDGIDNPEAEKNFSQTVNVLAAWAGAVTPEEASPLLRRAFGPGRPADIIPANAQFAYQTLSALFSCGCDDLAMSWITEGFGPMIEAGYDTLAEKWLFQDNRSACQGSGASLAAMLARYVLGVSPAEPGYRRILFHPRPGPLRSATGRLLTPFGPIEVSWKKHGKKITGRLSLPPALQGRPVLLPSGVALSA